MVLKIYLTAFVMQLLYIYADAVERYSDIYIVKLVTGTNITTFNTTGILHQINRDMYSLTKDAHSVKDNLLLKKLLDNPMVISAYQEKFVSREVRDETWTFSDPGFLSGKQDWYLGRMNVPQAWARCLSGKGVTIGVVDRGINKYHEDLKNNYDDTLDVDVQRDTDSAQPQAEGEVHGTNSAGVIAAEKNGFCGVGIAFEATITGIRLFGEKPLTDSLEARALGHRLDRIDIFSNSWGPPGAAQTVNPLGPLAREAVRQGASEGRNGKGAIYVFAAGNGGIYQDSCAYDGYVNSIRTIAVTAVHQNGRMLQASERCSAILVSAYSRSKLDRNSIVTTTDAGSGCTGNFGRTSAAAPQISAVVALALQANPSLNWRDVQHLLIRSAEHNRRLKFWEEDTVVNDAGFTVSNAFGFGLVNAEQMVDLASKWKGVPSMQTCDLKIVSGSDAEVPATFTKYLNCPINYIEHVEIDVDVTYCVRGFTRLIVTSPRRTRSVVFPGRVEDIRSTLLKLTADSVHFWGENPNGDWKVQIEPLQRGKISCYDTGILRELTLRIHGTATKPNRYMRSTLTNTCYIKKADIGCQNNFENPYTGQLLKTNPGESDLQLGVTRIDTCKKVCTLDPKCRSITFITDMYQKNRRGEWEHLGERCYINAVSAQPSSLRDLPSSIRGNIKIYSRNCA